MADESCDALVIGGGPAGLRAAEITSGAGWRTILADRMPSVGRKFLVAGRGGLNLTHSESHELFVHRYGGEPRWHELLTHFSPTDLRTWASELGVETFVGTSGRIFPVTKQAAPLLRRWVMRLKQQGVDFRLRHEWTGMEQDTGWSAIFRTPIGTTKLRARTVVLALGGGSWAQTGSNGAWVSVLKQAGVVVAPLTAANCGYEVSWPADFLRVAEGQPLKNIVVRAGEESVAGELLVTRYGLEGGALYQVGRSLRAMDDPSLTVDLKPAFTREQLVAKLPVLTGDPVDAAARAWKLGPVATALMRTRSASDPRELAELVKAFPIHLHGPRPLDEAISSAGGVAWADLDENLMLRRLPGVFCAGEMVDWEAPTGGYLLQGCFSTATRAALGVSGFLETCGTA